jgi:hypothetical protein
MQANLPLPFPALQQLKVCAYYTCAQGQVALHYGRPYWHGSGFVVILFSDASHTI